MRGCAGTAGAQKRFGHPAEIAGVLAFCASDQPGYLTGTDIVCDGGVVAAMTMADMLKLARPRYLAEAARDRACATGDPSSDPVSDQRSIISTLV